MKKFIPIILVVMTILLFLFSFWNLYPIKYKDIIVKYSVKYDLKPELISSLILAESGYVKDTVSYAGAVGLMQVLPTTAKEISNKLNQTEYDLKNPNDNIEFGCYYLKYLIDYYNGDLIYALCAYNAGLNNVKYWNFDGEIDMIPIEQTKNYVKKIVKNIQVYKVFYY